MPPSKRVVGLRESEETFSVADAIRKASDTESYKNAVQQINVYLASHPEIAAVPLSQEDQTTLRKEFALDAAEWGEVQSAVFTVFDAHHLEFSALLHEAVRALKVEDQPPLARAIAGFEWVTRQVGTQNRSDEEIRQKSNESLNAFPPNFVVRRGWGNGLERALVFLAMAQQLDLDGCMIALPAESDKQKRVRYWIPGVLIEKEICLFDTRLGLPIPGPNQVGVATLRQAARQADILKALTIDQSLPYDASPAQVKEAQVLVSCPLAAMSPRMKYLHDVLAHVDNIKLWGNPVESLKRFKNAASANGLKETNVRGWNQPGDISTPVRVLRNFLPASEGGVDRLERRSRAIAALLIPWQLYPSLLSGLKGEPDQRLRGLFGNPYPAFTLEARMPHDLMQAWLPGLFDPDNARSGSISELIERGQMPRDLMLHGRLDEATNLLVPMLDELRRQRTIQRSTVNAQVRDWLQSAVEAYGTSLRLERQASKTKQQIDPAAWENARQLKERLWSESGPVQALVRSASADYMAPNVTYLVALCKQEQAEKLQRRIDRAARAKKPPSASEAAAAKAGWKAAAGWWSTYLEEYPGAPATAAARRLKARALQALGDKEAARSLLLDQSGGLSSFDRMARLYMAKQLEQRQR